MRVVCLAIAVAATLGLGLGLGVACHHDAPPVKPEPGEQAPLPPASGTPIGYLIDAAVDLKLTDDQLAKLRDIDTALAAEIDEIDTQLRGTTEHHEPSQQPAGGGMRGGRRGGMGGMGGGGMGGMGGGMSGGGRHRRSNGNGAGSGSGGGAGAAHAADISRLTEQRAGDVRDALHRAFALLDDKQQAAATKLLDARGVDVDAGRSTKPASEPSERGEPDERVAPAAPPPTLPPPAPEPPEQTAPPPVIPPPSKADHGGKPQ